MTDVIKQVETRTKLTVPRLLFISSFILNFVIARIIHFSSPQEEVYNYYNNKGNIFNQYFVKKGWGWTTLVILLFYSNLLYKTPAADRIRVLRRAVTNYIIATVWWILFTQWCFGLPIMDKIFVWTGGKCKIDITNHDVNHVHSSFIHSLENIWESTGITSYYCRKMKGNWIGGHDPSGHVFLMIHSSLYLFFETSSSFPSLTVLKQNFNHFKRTTTLKEKLNVVWNTPQVLVGLLLALWWFMLLMTNIYFHSILEKFAGLLFGYIGVLIMYVLPDWL
ncbi:fit1 Acyl-coenzyme A diphosphatase fit1 [Candida maltosa Xu316]